ncbi:hypothetical protein IAT38_000029 [Cryptococcus sp. DSM 104549]
MTDQIFRQSTLGNILKSHLGMDLQPTSSPKSNLDSTVYLSTALVPPGTEPQESLKSTADKTTQKSRHQMIAALGVGQFAPLTAHSLQNSLSLVLVALRDTTINIEGRNEARNAWAKAGSEAGWKNMEVAYNKLNKIVVGSELAPSETCPTVGDVYTTSIAVTPDTMGDIITEPEARTAECNAELEERKAKYPECVGNIMSDWNPHMTPEARATLEAQEASHVALYGGMARTDIDETLANAEAEGKDLGSVDIISSFNYPRWQRDLETTRSVREAPRDDVSMINRIVNPESIRWQMVSPAPDAAPVWPPVSVLQDSLP